ERIEMIRLSFLDEGIPLDKLITATIQTLETNFGCVHYVLSYVPRIDFILARNPIIVKIFRDAGLNVVKPPLFNRDEWRGDRIRALMARRDPRWRSAVTPSTGEFIESIGGVERVAELYSSD
nr:nicotinamide-nucleotide adenylyltransferase [Desulfurococcales archaeon]